MTHIYNTHTDMETKLFDVKPLKTNKVELCKEDMIDYKILSRGTSAVTDSEDRKSVV